MFFKLAFKNVRKSIKDFSVYFLTLTFGVCVFYVFNSLGTQSLTLEMNEIKRQMVQNTQIFMGYTSVFITVILALLILYATSYLIKRRKKEFGVYMILGMPKGKINLILIIETLIIGIFALFTGLVVGVFLSQGMSVLTATLFEVNMTKFIFTFSVDAAIKAIAYFAFIFTLAIILQIFIVSKSKLIDLINAERKNESLKMRNLLVSVITFVISIVLLALAYYIFHETGIFKLSKEFGYMLCIGALGTLLFFFSLSGFLLRAVQSNKKFYYKNLNMFVFRQINSKVNSNFLSMTFICLMLLLAVGITSSVFSMHTGMSNSTKQLVPYEITVSGQKFDSNDKMQKVDMTSALKETGYNTDQNIKDSIELQTYRTDLRVTNLAREYAPDTLKEKEYENLEGTGVNAISLSDYNASMRNLGKEEITLNDGETAILGIADITDPLIQRLILNKQSIKVGNTQLTATKHLAQLPYNVFDTIYLQLVVPDNVADSLNHDATYLVGSFVEGDHIKAEEDLLGTIGSYRTQRTEKEQERDLFLNAIGYAVVYETQVSTTAMLIFIGIYLSIIFLIVSAAILALQQLSEANDSLHRYTLLRKLGVEEKMVNRSIFAQIAIYFFIPLALALIHATYGLSIVKRDFSMLQLSGTGKDMLICAVLLVVIYGGYFLTTYFGYKRIVKEQRN